MPQFTSQIKNVSQTPLEEDEDHDDALGVSRVHHHQQVSQFIVNKHLIMSQKPLK